MPDTSSHTPAHTHADIEADPKADTQAQTLPYNVHPALSAALSKKGYNTLTPVQTAVIAPKLAVSDLLVSAQTGSGKTVAFGLALAPTLLGDDIVFPQTDSALILAIAPTRELALQVKRELAWLYGQAEATLATCVGGMDMRTERRALERGAHIVVGTPGRLCDHIKRGSLDMSRIKAVVLDEADEMLKMGFREELELILSAAPEDHRSLMFSATMPASITALTKKYQKDAVRLKVVADTKQHLDIEYRALTVAPSDQENAIANLLQYHDAKNAIVFCDTRIAVNRMTSRFGNRGFSVVALSGELSQAERSHAIQAMRDGRAKVCIATDVAARGLDLPDLELVIHASIPKNPEALLHRSGRTGRAGRKGISVLIVPFKAQRRTERLLGNANITAKWGTPPSADEVLEKDNERLLASTILDEEVTEAERGIVSQLLAKHSPEHIAMAFVRQYRASRSAPEELSDVKAFEPSKHKGREHGETRGRDRATRNDFDDGVWFCLNLGRKQKAEPRWILPMLCKSGELKKSEIGNIKITDTQTFVEVAAKGVDRFVEAIGPEGKIEKAITATRIDGQPDFNASRGRRESGGKDGGRKERSSKKDYKEKSDYKKKSDFKNKHKASSDSAQNAVQPFTDKPKKPHKKKLARAAAKAERERAGKERTGQDRSGKDGKSTKSKERFSDKPKSKKGPNDKGPNNKSAGKKGPIKKGIANKPNSKSTAKKKNSNRTAPKRDTSGGQGKLMRKPRKPSKR